MLTTKIICFLYLLTYLVITGQLMYYFFVMGDALKRVSIDNFIEQRKIVDPLVQQRHIPVYYVCLALSIAVVLLTAGNRDSPLFIATLFALICLILDILLAKRVSAPVNTVINTHAAGEPGIDWEGLRTRWLFSIRVRGAISLAGFVSLLTALFWA